MECSRFDIKKQLWLHMDFNVPDISVVKSFNSAHKFSSGVSKSRKERAGGFHDKALHIQQMQHGGVSV